MYQLSLDDLPVPTLMVDFRPIAGLGARRSSNSPVSEAEYARLLRQCMIVEANQNALEFFGGLCAAELNDSGCFRAEFYSWADAYLAAFWSGQQTEWHDTVVYTRSGVSRPVMVRARPFSRSGAGYDHLLWSFSDVSSLKAAQAEAERARGAAEAANESKSTFLAVMSHEIRTPLNGVLGMAQMLLRRSLAAEEREMVSVISQSGEALLAILNDMLDLAKIEAGKMELEAVEFDLAELVGGAYNAFTGLAHKKGLSFDIAIAADAAGVYVGDPTRLRQILYNLISNALKFTEAGQVKVVLRRQDDELQMSVGDSGIGIPPDKLPTLFDSFTQADSSTTRKYGGTGLGLSICRRLAELMGGRIVVESEEGRGSTFSVVVALERAEGADPGMIETRAPVAEACPRPLASDGVLKILAAEDNAVNQLVLKTMLLTAGVELTLVENGRLAVEAWAAGQFDLILMDIQMPEMDGVTATRELRRLEREGRRPSTPIIALSANAMTHQIAQYREAGMDGHVEKPIKIDKLFAEIERAISPERGQAEVSV